MEGMRWVIADLNVVFDGRALIVRKLSLPRIELDRLVLFNEWDGEGSGMNSLACGDSHGVKY